MNSILGTLFPPTDRYSHLTQHKDQLEVCFQGTEDLCSSTRVHVHSYQALQGT